MSATAHTGIADYQDSFDALLQPATAWRQVSAGRTGHDGAGSRFRRTIPPTRTTCCREQKGRRSAGGGPCLRQPAGGGGGMKIRAANGMVARRPVMTRRAGYRPRGRRTARSGSPNASQSTAAAVPRFHSRSIPAP